jgi:predicted ATPase
MAELRTSLAKAIAGHGQLTLLVGEAGIGKTRTAEELAVHARSRNVRVLIGRCHEGEGAPPFWPWVQIVRSYLADHDPAAVRTALGPGAATIAQVIPDVYEHLPDLPVPPPLESQPARFRFFDSLTAFLKREARAQPLVLILDDLHWADRPSLLLLQFLARELNDAHLFILGTCRDVGVDPAHPLTQTLGELARVGGSQNLLLPNLTESDIARFIELTTARAPTAALVTAIFQKTTGNPFFVTEVVHALLRDGHLEQGEELSAASLPLPQRVRVAVEHRLGKLSASCRQVLTTAAVLGSVFDISVLKAVEDSSPKRLSGDVVLEVLDEAVAARFVRHDPNHIGRYRFSHALVRETLYATLSTEQRVQLHRQVGEALEHLWHVETEPSRSTSSGQMLSELAFHFFQAAPRGNTRKAMTYAVQAGERATALFAYEEAASHYQHALQLLALQPGDELQRCELLLALGDAQRRAGNTAAARETFRAAADLARILRTYGEGQQASSLLARAALGFAPGFGGITVAGGVEDPFVVNLLEESL